MNRTIYQQDVENTEKNQQQITREKVFTIKSKAENFNEK